MTSTERKLDEASYFFRLLNIDDPYFDYMLSAFLNAARSITWVMRCEFKNVQGWEQWYNNYANPENAILLLKQLNDLRIQTTKKLGVKTDYFLFQSDLLVDEKYYSELAKFILSDGDYELQITPINEANDSLESNEDAISFVGNINRMDKPFSNERDALKSACSEYLNLMSDIVKTCVTLFINQRRT